MQESLALAKHFGSLSRAILTLTLSVCGGISWIEIADIVENFGLDYFAVFLFYMFFMIFSILNLITGHIVDGAIQVSDNDRNVRLQKASEERNSFLKELL